MPCTDFENTPLPGDLENVLLRKILNRLCNVSSGGSGGVSQAYVDTRDAATLLAANNNAVAGDVATLAAAMASASALYVLKSGDTMTGALLMPAGAVGAPALSRSGDTNTGVWFPAADEFSIATAGVDRLHILSSGNVGIGTASPSDPLHLVGNLRVQEPADVFNYLQIQPFSDVFYFDAFGTAANSGGFRFRVNDATVDALTMLANGNVGIGIAAPLSHLHVTPSASGTNYFRIDHSDGTPRLQVGVLPGLPTFVGLWLGDIVPAVGNSAIFGNGADTYINAVVGASINFSIAGAARWALNSAGHFFAVTDNTYDIGASGANRPRDIFSAQDIHSGRDFISGRNVIAATAGVFYWDGFSRMVSPSDGVIGLTDIAGTSFNRLQLGGTTASFPSIKRSSATLQARLADDSAFADVSVASILTNNAAALVISSVAMNDGAAAALGTITNAPVAGNPTKWVPINDNGTTRYIPAW